MKRKFSFILSMFLIGVIMLTVMVNALSFTTTLTPSSTSVSEATEVVITVSVSNLDVGDNGINTFSASLEYDSDVFEDLTDSSVEGLNSWSATYNTSNGTVLLTKTSFVNSDEEIMQITLKTKEGVEEGTEGIVSLTGIQASNSEEEIDSADVSTTITVGTETSSSNTTNNSASIVINTNSTNTNNSSSTNNSSNLTNISSYNTSNDTDDSDIPYTGVSGDGFLRIILGVIFIALVIYIKIRKIDELK